MMLVVRLQAARFTGPNMSSHAPRWRSKAPGANASITPSLPRRFQRQDDPLHHAISFTVQGRVTPILLLTPEVLVPGVSLGDSQTIRTSVGAGVLWASPFGPLRLDYAIPLTQDSYDIVQQIRFGGGTKF